MTIQQMETGIFCTRCDAPVFSYEANRETFFQCKKCRDKIYLDIFPALFQNIAAGKTDHSLDATEVSSCFFHTTRSASTICDSCGRFICSLCDIELNRKHLCPTCLESKRKKKKITSLENHRTLYDSIAFYLATAPIFTVFFTLITAPLALYFCIRYWNHAGSIVPRTRIRFILAGIISLIQIFVWVGVLTGVLS